MQPTLALLFRKLNCLPRTRKFPISGRTFFKSRKKAKSCNQIIYFLAVLDKVNLDLKTVANAFLKWNLKYFFAAIKTFNEM